MIARLDTLVDAALARIALYAIKTTVHAAAFAERTYGQLCQTDKDLSVERDVAYGRLPEQRLDVVRLRAGHEPRPVLLYLHGGGFQQMSRQTHAWFGSQFARAGYVVFNADYRLAPRYPYPAASDDARTAAEFIMDHAARWGGNPTDLTVAGESAGANLALGLAISGRPILPRAAVLFSGLLQVSHAARLSRDAALSRILRARIASIPRDYIGVHARDLEPQRVDPYLDPLLAIERRPELARRLPPIYASVGTRDPVLSDTLRLRSALADSAVLHRVDVYGGEPHAFQGMPLRANARASWQACLEFLATARAATDGAEHGAGA